MKIQPSVHLTGLIHERRVARRESGPRLGIAVFVLLAALLLGALPEAGAASPTPPDAMTYQGFLVDGNGAPLGQTTPQNYPVAFRIYSGSSGGSAIWAEQQIVTVDKGSFSVMLGEGTQIGSELRPPLSSLFAGPTASDRYISAWVTIGGNTTEILPRLRLVPTPYAFLASGASRLVQPDGTSVVNYDGGQVNIFGSVAATGTIIGNGSGLTALNASQIASGTLNDARLSANVALRSANNNFSGNQTITSGSLGLRMTDGTANGNIVLQTLGGGASGFHAINFNGYFDGAEQRNNPNKARWRMIVDQRAGIDGFFIDTLNAAGLITHLNITTNGNVGIGIGANPPVAKLQVKDSNSDGGRIHVGGIGANAASKLITFGDADFVHVGEAGNDDILELKGTRIHMIGNVGIGIQDTQWPLAIQHNSDTRMRLQYPNGSYADFGRNALGVGTGGALYLQLNNNHFGAGNRSAVYDGDNNWDFPSDRRLKKDIADAESMLDRAMQVQVRRYRWKAESSDSKHQLGVIAQELQPVFPDLVSEFEDPDTKEKDLTVGYGDFALIAIKSLQELKRDHDAELTKLKTQLATLARENAELTARNQQRDDRLAALEGLVKKLAEAGLDDKKAADAGDKEQENEAAAVSPTNGSIR